MGETVRWFYEGNPAAVMRQMAEVFYYTKAQTAFHGSLKVLWQKI